MGKKKVLIEYKNNKIESQKKLKNNRIVGQKKLFVYVFGHKIEDC